MGPTDGLHVVLGVHNGTGIGAEIGELDGSADGPDLDELLYPLTGPNDGAEAGELVSPEANHRLVEQMSPLTDADTGPNDGAHSGAELGEIVSPKTGRTVGPGRRLCHWSRRRTSAGNRRRCWRRSNSEN